MTVRENKVDLNLYLKGIGYTLCGSLLFMTRKKAVPAAKITWFQRKALEAKEGGNGEKIVWRCIKEKQHAKGRFIPNFSCER